MTNAARQRRWRQRRREGALVVRELVLTPDQIAALEDHGYSDDSILYPEDAARAVTRLLSLLASADPP